MNNNNDVMLIPQNVSLIESFDTSSMKNKIAKINEFQGLINSQLKDKHDYGVVPGTDRKSLFKPGAEKIFMLMGLRTSYEIIQQNEDFEKAFFSYTIRWNCYMNNPYDPTQPIKVTEGIGHCNSKEKKYAGMWKSEKEVPTHLDKSRLEKREKNGQYGPYVQYKVENEDIYSLVNTIIKMAKKRAMVDAALTVGSLSDIFTQDIVDEDEIQSKDEAITTMTLEDAQKVVAPVGRQKGKSLGEIYKIDRGSFEWLAQNARDEVVKRACHVITVSVEQHKESKTANAAAQQKPATPAPEVKEAAATTFVAPEGDPFIGTPMERK